MRCELPAWVRSRVGSGKLLLIAPHGGISERDLLAPAAGTSRSNDLFTAELAALLAERCDASLIANTSLDRNQLDLNRLRDVRARAPWLLEAIAEHLERILARHDEAEIVFVHGWHIVQPKCDIGIGESLDDDDDAHLRPGLTVSADYLRARLDRLRAGCARAGIATAYGERWPAAHANNLMQVFRRRSTRSFDGPAARLAAWARDRRLCATQLELGAPLRWPGAWRDAFCAAMSATFADDRKPARAWGWSTGDASADGAPQTVPADRAPARSADPPADREQETIAPGAALRVFDPRAGSGGIALAAAMGIMPGGRLAARLIVLPGGSALALFTGEERSPAAGRVGALSLVRSSHGLELRFDGPVLLAPDGGRHFRSEAEQAKARIVRVRVRIDLAADDADGGAAAGEVELDGRRWAIAARGFTTPPLARVPAVAGGRVTRLCADFGPRGGLVATVEMPSGERAARRFRACSSGDASVGDVLGAPREDAFGLAVDGEAVRCRPKSHVAWLRSLPDGRYARVTLGTAEFSLGSDGRGSGFFEHVEDVRHAGASAAGDAVAEGAHGEPAP